MSGRKKGGGPPSPGFGGGAGSPPTPTPTPTPTPDDPGGALGPPDASTDAQEFSAEEQQLYTDETETTANDLLSTARYNGLSDPYGFSPDGWSNAQPEVDPYTNMASGPGTLDAFVGEYVDSYSGMALDYTNANSAFVGFGVDPYTNMPPGGINSDPFDGQGVNPFFGLELTSAPVDGLAPEEPTPVDVNDPTGGRNSAPMAVPQTPASPSVGQASAPSGETGAIPTLPPELAAQGGSGLTYAGTVELNGVTYNRFQNAQGDYVLVQPEVQQTREITVTADVPFNRTVSDPAALEAADNRGRLQAGDVEQFFKGGYNALVDLAPIALGPILGPFAKAADIPKATIDQRFGGAAIAGGQIAEALVLEGASKLPEVGAAFGKGLESDVELVGPAVRNPFVTGEPLAAAGAPPAAAGGPLIPKNLQLNIQAHASVSNVVRSLRNIGTDESVAVAKLISRGEVKVEFGAIYPGDPEVARLVAGYYDRGSNTLSVTKLGLAGDNRRLAGIVGHEAYHFLQDVPGSSYSIFEEVEAYTFQEILLGNIGYEGASAFIDSKLPEILKSPVYRTIFPRY